MSTVPIDRNVVVAAAADGALLLLQMFGWGYPVMITTVILKAFLDFVLL